MSKWFEIGDLETSEQKPQVQADLPAERQDPPSKPAPQPPPIDPDRIEEAAIEDLYDWVARTRVPAPQFREPVHHVSQIRKMCSRKVVFAECFPELDVEEPATAVDQLTWDFGTATHKWWQNHYWGPMGWLWGDWMCTRCRCIEPQSFMPREPCQFCGWADVWSPLASEDRSCQVTCRWPGGFVAENRNCSMCNRWGSWDYLEPRVIVDELSLVGSCDGILRPPIEHYGVSPLALEVKTMNKKQFDGLKGPPRDHVFQLNTYMHFLEINHGIIVYIHKGEYDGKKGNKPRAYFIEHDQQLADEAIRRIREWQEAEETGELGRRICPGIDSAQAKRCPFYSVCYLDDVQEQVASIQAGRRE